MMRSTEVFISLVLSVAIALGIWGVLKKESDDTSPDTWGQKFAVNIALSTGVFLMMGIMAVMERAYFVAAIVMVFYIIYMVLLGLFGGVMKIPGGSGSAGAGSDSAGSGAADDGASGSVSGSAEAKNGLSGAWIGAIVGLSLFAVAVTGGFATMYMRRNDYREFNSALGGKVEERAEFTGETVNPRFKQNSDPGEIKRFTPGPKKPASKRAKSGYIAEIRTKALDDRQKAKAKFDEQTRKMKLGLEQERAQRVKEFRDREGRA
jgi:hypothetical protein